MVRCPPREAQSHRSGSVARSLCLPWRPSVRSLSRLTNGLPQPPHSQAPRLFDPEANRVRRRDPPDERGGNSPDRSTAVVTSNGVGKLGKRLQRSRKIDELAKPASGAAQT